MPVKRKVQASVLGGALGILVVWLISLTGTDVPAEVGGAFSTVFGGLLGYFVPDAEGE